MPVRVPEQVAVRLGAVAAGDRDVELRIAPHAVLRDVEARGLDVLLDADPPEPLHRPQGTEGRGESERADGGEAEELHPNLVQRAGVDEAARAGAEVGGERGHREET